MRTAGPSEPEESDGKDEGAENHGWESFFWDYSAVFLEFAGEAGFSDDGDGETSEDNTDQDAKEWKCTDSLVPLEGALVNILSKRGECLLLAVLGRI